MNYYEVYYYKSNDAIYAYLHNRYERVFTYSVYLNGYIRLYSTLYNNIGILGFNNKEMPFVQYYYTFIRRKYLYIVCRVSIYIIHYSVSI